MKGFAVLLLIVISTGYTQQPTTMQSESVLHYLALGDSYTIGEMVPAAENFPNQTIQFLAAKNLAADVRIIAKTGWTTDELSAGIEAAGREQPFHENYDRVSLLIGVNNQYRGRPVDDYRREFERLLKQAIDFAGNQPEHVVVVSIPDWGVTPFAAGGNPAQIALEIDAYNMVNRELAESYRVHYLDITPWTREAAGMPDLVAGDELHPSGKEYRRWAEKIAGMFAKP